MQGCLIHTAINARCKQPVSRFTTNEFVAYQARLGCRLVAASSAIDASESACVCTKSVTPWRRHAPGLQVGCDILGNCRVRQHAKLSGEQSHELNSLVPTRTWAVGWLRHPQRLPRPKAHVPPALQVPARECRQSSSWRRPPPRLSARPPLRPLLLPLPHLQQQGCTAAVTRGVATRVAHTETVLAADFRYPSWKRLLPVACHGKARWAAETIRSAHRPSTFMWVSSVLLVPNHKCRFQHPRVSRSPP